MISSKMSKTLCLSQAARRIAKYSGGGTTKPAEEMDIGSMMTAATVSGSSASMVRSTKRAQVIPQAPWS